MPLFFWFHPFLVARAEIHFVGFLVKTMAPKKHFEINWPLGIIFFDTFKSYCLERWNVQTGFDIYIQFQNHLGKWFIKKYRTTIYYLGIFLPNFNLFRPFLLWISDHIPLTLSSLEENSDYAHLARRACCLAWLRLWSFTW